MLVFANLALHIVKAAAFSVLIQFIVASVLSILVHGYFTYVFWAYKAYMTWELGQLGEDHSGGKL